MRLRPGRSCWRIEPAARFAALVDGDACGRALRHALAQARVSVRVLGSDFPLLYAFQREWLSTVKLDLRTHPRLRFRLDGRHPLGGSHHQTVVVVDDSVAFAGGLDLAGARWDRSGHRAAEPLRTDGSGRPYAPFHDVQAMVDGPA